MYDKSNKIHSTVVLEGNINMGLNNTILPNTVMIGNISMGNNNMIGPNCTFLNTVEMGDNNKFVAQCSVGTLGEMGSKGDFIEQGYKVIIGSNNTFREFLTLNSPVRRTETRVKSNCYFMARTHIAHDCIVHNNVVMATNSLIGGGTIVYDFGYIGLGSITHQWINIGESAMIGLQAGNTKHIPPFVIATGIPSKILKFNKVGAERRGYSTEIINEVDQNFKKIINQSYKSDNEIIKTIHSFLVKHENCLTTFLR